MKETTVTCDRCQRTQEEEGYRFREVTFDGLFGDVAYDLCKECLVAFVRWIKDE